MDHRAHRGLVDAKPEGDGSNQYAHLVCHPAFLIDPPLIFFHLAVIGNRWDPLLLEEINRLLDARDGRRIHDDGAVGVVANSVHQQSWLLSVFTLPRHISQISPMKARYVLSGVPQLKLGKDVMTDPPGCACGEGSDRKIG